MTNRVEDVVMAIVEGVRGALKEKNVSFTEYRMALKHLMATAEAKELPLLIDVFLNITICEIENANFKGTPSDLEGPYFRPDAPFVDREIKTMPEFGGEPTLMRGKVTDMNGNPLAGAVVNIWQSTPDGKYSGFHENIPVDYYRGKVRTDENGYYEATCTAPAPYQIKNNGPTGQLFDMMGRHSWRPAHVHYKTQMDGYHTVTTRAYFEGGEYVGDDCCFGRSDTGELVMPEKYEDGQRLIEVDFVLDAA